MRSTVHVGAHREWISLGGRADRMRETRRLEVRLKAMNSYQ